MSVVSSLEALTNKFEEISFVNDPSRFEKYTDNLAEVEPLKNYYDYCMKYISVLPHRPRLARGLLSIPACLQAASAVVQHHSRRRSGLLIVPNYHKGVSKREKLTVFGFYSDLRLRYALPVRSIDEDAQYCIVSIFRIHSSILALYLISVFLP